jgi:gamma-glutamyl-gamma-aminobutyraldehyde dehydrogenase
MHFQHLTYWQDKAKNSAIETGYLLTVNTATPPIIPRLKPSTRPSRRWRTSPAAKGRRRPRGRGRRGVFDRGDWSQASPAQRKAVLNKLADLMEAIVKSWRCWKRWIPANRSATACATIFPAPPAPFAGMPKRG